jgi:hypothetical protein
MWMGLVMLKKIFLMLYMHVEFLEKLENHVKDCVQNWDNIHNSGSVLHMRHKQKRYLNSYASIVAL